MKYDQFKNAVVKGDYVECNWDGDKYYFTFHSFNQSGGPTCIDGFVYMCHGVHGTMYPRYSAGVGTFSTKATFKIIERNGLCIS